jgi:hypothetical protein
MKLRAQNVYATDKLATVDGIEVPIRLGGTKPEPDVGWAGGPEVEWDTADIVLRYREDWDEAHPGVEPTQAAMEAVLEDAGDEIAELAAQYAADGAEWWDDDV